MRASERQRASGHQRPAWPGNAMKGWTVTFRGFPADAFDFFFELEANNERSWWQANRQRFETSVATPMREMLDALEPEFGAFKVFRMNRDVRFSADKSPYKTAHAAVTQEN